MTEDKMTEIVRKAGTIIHGDQNLDFVWKGVLQRIKICAKDFPIDIEIRVLIEKSKLKDGALKRDF